MAKPKSPRILAAGGLLWRDAGRDRICVVHRSRHDDICLPKGKLDPGERFVEAALREVFEETGYRARLAEFVGELLYPVKGIPKSVLYWSLETLESEPSGMPDPDEVDSVEWLPVSRALRQLSYASERDLLEAAGVDNPGRLRPDELNACAPTCSMRVMLTARDTARCLGHQGISRKAAPTCRPA